MKASICWGIATARIIPCCDKVHVAPAGVIAPQQQLL